MRLEAMVRSSADIIAVVDAAARLIEANPAAMNVLGLDPNDFVGQDLLEWIHPLDREPSGRVAPSSQRACAHNARTVLRMRAGRRVLAQPRSDWEPGAHGGVGRRGRGRGARRDPPAARGRPVACVRAALSSARRRPSVGRARRARRERDHHLRRGRRPAPARVGPARGGARGVADRPRRRGAPLQGVLRVGAQHPRLASTDGQADGPPRWHRAVRRVPGGQPARGPRRRRHRRRRAAM